MREFASDYRNFEKSIKRKARFVHDEQVSEFLKTVLDTSRSRRRKLRKGRLLVRAQPGSSLRSHRIEDTDEEIELPDAHPKSRMIPTAKHAIDGRANPVGIPVLYLASSQKAAMAEIRPWMGSYVSLAKFEVIRDCTVVDCSLDKSRGIFGIFDGPDELDAAAREAGVWGEIASAFSKPVSIEERHLDYLPTQVLAEAFRKDDCDGIVYKSLLDEKGKNIALFDVAAAKFRTCRLFRTRLVEFKFDPQR